MESNLWDAFVRIMVCLPIVAILAYLFIKFGFSKNHFRRSGYLELVEQISLMPKASLNVVKVGEEYVLFSATENGVVFVARLDNYQANEPTEFQLNLADAIKRMNKGSKQHG